MHVPVEYDDEVERRKTNPLLLPRVDDGPKPIPIVEAQDSANERSPSPIHRRSVLWDETSSTLRASKPTPRSTKLPTLGNSTLQTRTPDKAIHVTWADVCARGIKDTRGNSTR